MSGMSSERGEVFYRAVQSLYLSPTFSDLKVKCKDCEYPAHRLVLFAFGNKWGTPIETAEVLDWSHLDKVITLAVLKWIYTATLPEDLHESALLSLMHAAGDFHLPCLVKSSEERLVSLTSVENCFQMYAIAAGANADLLLNRAGQIIAKNWKKFTKEDFKDLEPAIVCKLFMEIHHDYLHQIVSLGRVDVLTTFVEKERAAVTTWINGRNDEGRYPLELALRSRRWDLAEILLKCNANVNALNESDWNYLQCAIDEKDIETVLFLLKHNADVFYVTPSDELSCLHFVSKPGNNGLLEDFSEFQSQATKALLEKGADPNRKDASGMTALHFALEQGAVSVVGVLLQNKNVDVNSATKEGFPPLKFALEHATKWRELAEKLIEAGGRSDVICTKDRLSLLQVIIEAGLEPQTLFLCERVTESELNHTNTSGETALHLACIKGMSGVVAKLLEAGANPNIETIAPTSRATTLNGGSNVSYIGYKQTCLHYAILHDHVDVVRVLLDKQNILAEKLDCNLKDSVGNTPFSLAFANNCVQLVPKLIECGADVNLRNAAGLTLLHKAILDADTKTAFFLLNHGADINARTLHEDKHPLHLAIENQLPDIVDAICKKGVDMSVQNGDNQCALWSALENDLFNIASILVRHGADTNAWGPGPDGTFHTLLHLAIDVNLQEAAIFLIRSGCDVNSPQKLSLKPGSKDANNGWTPLHLCCEWGLENVVKALLEHGADVNKKDADGKTALHIAIENKQDRIIDLLVWHPSIEIYERDNRGLSPFALAVSGKCNKAAGVILSRFPNAAEQMDKNRKNLLHNMLEANQLESILFLLAIKVDVNSCTRDAAQTPPLHLAAAAGNEVIVRSLILAGARVDAVDAYKQTALHVAVSHGHAVVITALLSHECNPDVQDSDGNNALHVACQKGNLDAARVLLLESSVNAEMLNNKGQNPLHTLAKYGKENAYAICNLIAETMPEFPLDQPDVDGNTALLIAYMKGNGNLCRSLVKAGAMLGAMNLEGVTIFDYHVATKQLLYNLLESLEKEPRWSDGEICLECGIKFKLTMRRHHCRHCGRVLCSKCSGQDMAILKYNLNKPVRVCEVCFLVLQGGAA